jgi:hypothetical protein
VLCQAAGFCQHVCEASVGFPQQVCKASVGFAGRPLTAEEAGWDFVLENPNKWLILVDYLTNTSKIKPFMATCASKTVDTDSRNERLFAFSIISRSTGREFESLPDNQEMLLCLPATGTRLETYVLYARII